MYQNGNFTDFALYFILCIQYHAAVRHWLCGLCRLHRAINGFDASTQEGFVFITGSPGKHSLKHTKFSGVNVISSIPRLVWLAAAFAKPLFTP